MLPSRLAIFWPPICRWAQCSQVRTKGRPVAASDWALSSSWWGKTRSRPPVCRSNEGPSSFMLMAEHSMCQPGLPSPMRVRQLGSPGLGPLPAGEWGTAPPPAQVPGEGGLVASRQLADGHALPDRVPDDLVVHVGDVHDPLHRVAVPGQVAAQQAGEGGG